ncbi:MAG TPA: hypothetical protein P5076_13525, partial [Myxococcota bacterium]|nr:hypothetical protein [Myxococcota bacterium]
MARTLAWGAIGFVCLCGAGARAGAEPGQDLQRLDWDQPVLCVEDPAGKRWRVQCAQAPEGLTPRCLLAPDATGDGGPLQRVQYCESQGREGWERLHAQGATLAPALAEAPPGWHRDLQGRVFQVTFDLLQRFQLGAQWSPAFGFDPQRLSLGRARFEMALVASWLEASERSRHTLRALEGQVAILDLTSRGLLFAYDLDRSADEPFLRLTTFFGPPARHDLYLDL